LKIFGVLCVISSSVSSHHQRNFASKFSQIVIEWVPGMGFQKLEEIFSLHTYEISFVAELGGFGGGKRISMQKNKR